MTLLNLYLSFQLLSSSFSNNNLEKSLLEEKVMSSAYLVYDKLYLFAIFINFASRILPINIDNIGDNGEPCGRVFFSPLLLELL